MGAMVPFLGFVLLITGGTLLYDAFSTSDIAQTAKIVGGASVLSLGLISLYLSAKNWWKWRSEYKEYRNE